MSLYSIVLLFFVAFSLQGKNLYWDFKELQQEGERYVFKSSKDSGLLRASQVLQHQGIDSGHALQCGPEIMHRISRHRLDMQNAEIAISFKPTADITAKSSLYTYQENTWGRAYFDVFISKNSEIGLLFRINTPEEKKEFELLTPPVRLDSQRYHDLRITLQSGGMGRIYLDGRLLAEENGAYCFSDFKAPPVDQHHPFAQIGSSYYYCGIHQPFTGLIAKLSIQEMPAVGKALETSLAPDAQPAAQSRSNANILAKPCVSPLLIDGKFAEPCYDDAEWSIPFMVLGSMSKDINGLWLEADSKFSRAAAKAAVFYDQEYIYAAIKAPFPVDLPPKAEMKNGENIWLDDCVEFFLHNDQQYYYQILVNAKGAWQAIKYSLDGSLRIDWEPQGVMVAGNLREAEFNIEIALPFKELGESSPQDGAVWKVNFAREGASCGGLSTWAAVGTSFLAPDRFGKLIFGNRKAYYKQQFQALQEQSKRLPEIPEQLQEILRETATLIAKEGDKPAAWLNLHNQLDMLRNRIVQASNKGKSLLLLEADMWANFPPQRKIPFALQEPTELKLEAPGGSRAIGSLLLCNLSERLSMGNLLFKADKGSEAIEPLLRFREVAFIELSGGTMIPDPIFELPMGSMLRVPPNSTVMLWLDLDCSDLKPGDYSGNIKLYPSYSGVEEKQLKLSLRVSPVDVSKVYVRNWTYAVRWPKDIEMLREYQFNCFIPIPTHYTPQYDAEGKASFPMMDAEILALLNNGIRLEEIFILIYPEFFQWARMRMPDGSYTDFMEPAWQEELRKRLTLLRDYLKEKYDISYDQYAFYPTDEPNGDPDNPQDKAYFAFVGGRFIKSIDPKFQLFCNPWKVADGRHQQYFDLFEILEPCYPRMTDELKKLYAQSGREIWTYSVFEKSVGAPRYRHLFWENMHAGFKGPATFYDMFACSGDPFNSYDSNIKNSKVTADYGAAYKNARRNGFAASRRLEAWYLGYIDFKLARFCENRIAQLQAMGEDASQYENQLQDIFELGYKPSGNMSQASKLLLKLAESLL